MLVSVCLEIVLLLTQDRCTVCAKCITGSKIALDTPDRTARRPGSCGISFRSVSRVLVLEQDRCTACIERTIGKKIILDTPDRTPK
jgi:hypothetical protein